jgi:hypothetical protein
MTKKWRKRVGVEPTGDGIARRPPVLKTGTITGPHALPYRLDEKNDSRVPHPCRAFCG